jgi:lipoprotein signal peptidase
MCLSAVIQQGIVVFYTKSTNWLAYVFNIFCVFVVVSKCLLHFKKIFRYGKYLSNDI